MLHDLEERTIQSIVDSDDDHVLEGGEVRAVVCRHSPMAISERTAKNIEPRDSISYALGPNDLVSYSTASFEVGEASLGVYTLRYRQSSLGSGMGKVDFNPPRLTAAKI